MIISGFIYMYNVIGQLLQSVFNTLLYLCCAVALAHSLGWLDRWIWFILEGEATKILNNTKVTIGSFRIDWSDILEGKISFEASNVILHTKDRREWGWESPLLARVGYVSAQLNVPVTIFHELVLRKKLPIEVYSVVVSDVQVFIERHDQVINVYLCDPAAILPPAPYLDCDPPPSSPAEDNDQEEINTDNNDSEHKERAEKLVQDMLQAVKSLGRAAQQGSLQSAVKQHSVEMAERLRNELSSRNRDTERLEQSVAVMEEVGKVAAESLKAPQLILPERKPGDGPEPPYIRVGRIVVNDVRIFTKDSWIPISTNTSKGSKDKSSSRESPSPMSDTQDDSKGTDDSKGKWNKPIFIESLVVRAAELCPPMSSKDDDDLPAVYQRADKVIEIVWRRLLAEMAKSNTGRLFSTAIGEVLSFIQTQPGTISSEAVTPKAGARNTISRSRTGSKSSLTSVTEGSQSPTNEEQPIVTKKIQDANGTSMSLETSKTEQVGSQKEVRV